MLNFNNLRICNLKLIPPPPPNNYPQISFDGFTLLSTYLLGEGILDLAALSGLGIERRTGCGRPALCGDMPLCMGVLGCLRPDTLGEVGLMGGWRRENCLC